MKRLILILVLLSVILSGCDLTQDLIIWLEQQQNPVTPTPFQTPTPTSPPTPTPSPTPIPAARVKLGDQAILYGDYDQAVREFQNALNEASSEDVLIAALLGLGHVYVIKEEYALAIDKLSSVTTLYPESYESAAASFLLGQSYTALEEYPQAVEAYRMYLDRRPGILDAYVQEIYGDALLKNGDFNAAIQAYEIARDADRLSSSVYLDLQICKIYTQLGDEASALRCYLTAYEKPRSTDYEKAQANLEMGKIYMAMNLPEQAYARYLDSVTNFPRAYEAYLQLFELVNANIVVDDLNRGLVDYFAGQYGVAVDAFQRYIDSHADHDGTAHHYKALSLRAMEKYDKAIEEWNLLIADHVGDRFFASAWEEKATTLADNLNRSETAVETLQKFASLYPKDEKAADFLYSSGRMLEMNGRLTEATTTWEKMIDEYASADLSIRGLFLAGICQFRLGNFQKAISIHQHLLELSSLPEDRSQALFWIGKSYAALQMNQEAQASWEEAAAIDPQGYYGIRSQEVLTGELLFSDDIPYDLGYNLEAERFEANKWLQKTFNVVEGEDPLSLSAIYENIHIQRANAYWEIGVQSLSQNEVEAARAGYSEDAINLFRLLQFCMEKGLYRTAINAGQQILSLSHQDSSDGYTLPKYFSHTMYGIYYKEIILETANKEGWHPFTLFGLIRQESLFSGIAESSAGAIGLMQIMPATGRDMAQRMLWPADYQDSDLERPYVNIPLGVHYLSLQRDYFDGDLVYALAAYNAGPGNALAWKKIANNDTDLFLEVIRFSETRDYIKLVIEGFWKYKKIFSRGP